MIVPDRAVRCVSARAMQLREVSEGGSAPTASTGGNDSLPDGSQRRHPVGSSANCVPASQPRGISISLCTH